MLSVMLNVIMLSVMAPKGWPAQTLFLSRSSVSDEANNCQKIDTWDPF
jgi:hypothetical protein